ncbi:MAG: hypothetical protein ACOCXZ_02240 [Chloroflexota bacterium]
MTILLTGFSPFPGVPVNPSQAVVEAIAADPAYGHVITTVLPTAFAAAGDCVAALIKAHQPRAVMMLGVAAGRDAINLERFALNINDASVPDTSGVQASGQPIDPDGPAAYTSTLPLDRLFAALDAARIPAKFSNHAGAYVCNHVFYTARHTVEQARLPTRVGFVHIPMHSDDADQPGADKGLPLGVIVDAVKACLDALT